MQSNEGRVFGAVEYTEKDAVKDWRALGCEELLRRAIIALDGSKMEAEEDGMDAFAIQNLIHRWEPSDKLQPVI